MTDTTTTEQTTETTNLTESTEPTTETTETTEVETPNHEAAGYRRKLREAETSRDALASQVETLQRAAVDAITAKVLAAPAGLWAAGVAVADLLAEDGTVDRDKVLEAAKTAAETFGLAKPIGGNYVRREGTSPSSARHDSFEDALRQ